MHDDKFTVINIRDCLQENNDIKIGEDELFEILFDFFCPKNPDVEKFLKRQSIEFVKKNQSGTYLVFSNEDAVLVGYFTLTIKPISVCADKFSNNINRKLLRISELNEEKQTYHMAAYLIAQLGKNFADDAIGKITGKQLLEIAMNHVKKEQYAIGGMVVFIETEKTEKMLKFYDLENGFKEFETKETRTKGKESQQLIQMLKIL